MSTVLDLWIQTKVNDKLTAEATFLIIKLNYPFSLSLTNVIKVKKNLPNCISRKIMCKFNF